MTVQNNPSTGPVQPNSARSDDASQAQGAAQTDDTESAESGAPDETASSDRVEISDAARAAQSEAGGDSALIERGRRELASQSLSDARLTELQEQVESGRFTEPDVTQQVVEGLAGDLSSPGSGGT